MQGKGGECVREAKGDSRGRHSYSLCYGMQGKGREECAADCTVTDRRCTCGRAGVACDHGRGEAGHSQVHFSVVHFSVIGM